MSPNPWPDGHFYSAVFDHDDARNSLMRMDPWLNPKGISHSTKTTWSPFKNYPLISSELPFLIPSSASTDIIFSIIFFPMDASIYFSKICKFKPIRI